MNAPVEPTHGHRWAAASHHLTSAGDVVYECCACGAWRVRRNGWSSLTEPVGRPRRVH